MLILLREDQAPSFPSRAGGADSPLSAVCLDRFLPEWLGRERDNPFVAVFAPRVLDSDDELVARPPSLWRTLQEAHVGEAEREALSQMLKYWLFDRFWSLTAGEIWAMLHRLTPLVPGPGRGAPKEGCTAERCNQRRLLRGWSAQRTLPTPIGVSRITTCDFSVTSVSSVVFLRKIK